MYFKAIDGVLRMYLKSLIVNCQGDLVARGKSYPTFEDVLHEYYESRIDMWVGENFYNQPDFMFIDLGGSHDT